MHYIEWFVIAIIGIAANLLFDDVAFQTCSSIFKKNNNTVAFSTPQSPVGKIFEAYKEATNWKSKIYRVFFSMPFLFRAFIWTFTVSIFLLHTMRYLASELALLLYNQLDSYPTAKWCVDVICEIVHVVLHNRFIYITIICVWALYMLSRYFAHRKKEYKDRVQVFTQNYTF